MHMRYVPLLVVILTLNGLHNLAAQSKKITMNINSPFDEQTPLVSPDGNYLFFTIAHHANNVGGTKDKGDIWYAQWQDSTWSQPLHGGTVINNKNWNGVLGFASDGSIYLHHHYKDDKQGISIAQKKGDHWEKPTSVAIPYFMNKSQHQSGTISANGEVMMLALESYGTIGAEDIYVLFKKEGKWTDPKNIGSVINTRFQEMTPVIAADNRTLFFASNGLNGKGSLDIYSSTRLDDTWLAWSPPVNLSEVNSEGREVSFNYDPITKRSWFVSTKDSDGYGDIKFMESTPELDTLVDEPAIDSVVVVEKEMIAQPTEAEEIAIVIEGVVRNAKDSSAVAATLSLTLQSSDTTLVTVASAAGGYEMAIPFWGRGSMKVAAPQYLPVIEEIHLDSASFTLQKHYWLMPVKMGEIVQLKNVLFEQGKAIMLPTSFPDLDAVVAMMNDNPFMEIALSGHTDNQGSSKLNFQLSEERVGAVMDYLEEKGISKKRITGKGYGGSMPIASNKNPETRKLNRRVEFTIVKQ